MSNNEQTAINHFDDLYPGRFVKAGNLNGKRPTVTIARVYHEMLAGDKGEEQRVVMAFSETPRQLVLCKLNGTAIRAMFGSNVQNWIGKRIVLYATNKIMPMPPKRKGDTPEECIRIFGSPDIEADLAIEFTPPRRKAIPMTLKATGSKKVETPPADDKPFFDDEPAPTEAQ